MKEVYLQFDISENAVTFSANFINWSQVNEVKIYILHLINSYFMLEAAMY